MNRDGAVPIWDGQAKGWRRYCREVCWFVQATKVNQRRHLATRLIARLTGSAMLLAMSWPQAEFDNDRGVLTYLQRLARSPLVRRSLPNAAATMTQYFSFKKLPNESISSFLVRETLSYEEFQEALIRLREERSGQDPADQDFGLEAILQREEQDWSSWNKWQPPERKNMGTTPRASPSAMSWRTRAFAAAAAAASGEDDEEEGEAKPRPEDYDELPQHSPHASEPDPVEQATVVKTPQDGAEVGMTSADSFVLDVLRGWRLLQAASLSRDEWRDVLSSTGNKLDFESVSNALQVLWDDQLLQPRHTGASGPSYQLHWMEDGSPYDSWGDDQSSWWDDEWYDAQWHWDDSESWPVEDEPDSSPKELSPAELEDPSIREALQSEKMAESLAAEAKLTYQKAQEVTAALRKDCGFAAITSGGKGSGKSSTGCYICGHQGHMARECPDRWAPKGKSKGKGKFGDMIDPYEYQFTSKGKGKKGKNVHFTEYEGTWVNQKGKGRFPMRSFPVKGSGAVNAYGLELYPLELVDDMNLTPLEFLPTTSLSSPITSDSAEPVPQVSSSLNPFEGMVDSGATTTGQHRAFVSVFGSVTLKRNWTWTMTSVHTSGMVLGSGIGPYARSR